MYRTNDVRRGFIAASRIANQLTRSQIDTLLKHLDFEKHERGELMLDAEGPSDHLLILLFGQVEVRTCRDDLIYVLGPGEMIGEVGFLDGKRRSAVVTAMADCETAVLSKASFDRLPMPITRMLYKNIATQVCAKLRITTDILDATLSMIA